jgi:hypothetical protein
MLKKTLTSNTVAQGGNNRIKSPQGESNISGIKYIVSGIIPTLVRANKSFRTSMPVIAYVLKRRIHGNIGIPTVTSPTLPSIAGIGPSLVVADTMPIRGK